MSDKKNNIGIDNSGNWNSGDWNSGNRNSGNWNSGNWNSGYFNTDTPCVRIFNVQTDITFAYFYSKYNTYMDIPLNRWVDKSEMSDTEKSEVTGWETMGGYLKTLPFKEACQIWWKENPSEHERFLSLPHFNADIFEEITGIKTGVKETIKIGNQTYDKHAVEEALKNVKSL